MVTSLSFKNPERLAASKTKTKRMSPEERSAAINSVRSGSSSSSKAASPTPSSAPSPSPSNKLDFVEGRYEAADQKIKQNTPVRDFVSGVKQGFFMDPESDPMLMNAAEGTGFVAGSVGGIASMGTGAKALAGGYDKSISAANSVLRGEDVATGLKKYGNRQFPSFADEIVFESRWRSTVEPVLQAVETKMSQMPRTSQWFKQAANVYDDVVVGAVENLDEANSVAATLVKNSKNVKLSKNVISQATKGLVGGAVLTGMIMTAVGTYPWDAHLKVDTVAPTYSIAARDAREAGDFETAAQLEAALEDFLSPTLGRKLQSIIPGWNVIRTSMDGLEAQRVAMRAYRDAADYVEANGSGDTDWAAVEQQRLDNDLLRQQQQFDFDAELIRRREDSSLRYLNAQDELSKKQAKRDLDYYEEQLKLKDKYAQIADTREREYQKWYFQALADYRESSSPSKLSFGLL